MGVILGCRSARAAALPRPRGAGKGLGVGGGDKRDDNGFFLEAPRGGEGKEGEEGEAFHCGRGRGQGQWLVVSG